MVLTLTSTYFSPERGVPYPEITRAYALLERNGFMVDVDYLNKQAKKAAVDESEQLSILRDYAKTVVPGDTEPDKIWSSPSRLDNLLHNVLELEPSPIWKKGEVPLWKGKRKTDGVALGYLAAANPEHREMINHLLKLKRIRSSKKYLDKIPNFVQSDGFIHPTYGPASDDDESSGTNSGRTVMKSPEGQQIPNGKDKDPYGIRRGFIAPPGRVLVVRDYSAMEAVLLHAICLALFGDNSLEDVNSSTFHSANARMVFGDFLKWKHPSGRPISSYSLEEFSTDPYLKDRRRDAKTVFYGLQFCKGVRGFAYSLLDSNGMPIGETIAGKIVDGFNTARPGIKKFQNFVWDELKLFSKWNNTRKGYTPGISDLVGRPRNVAALLNEYASTGKTDWMFAKAWRQCCNHPEQAGGANIKGTALVHIMNSGIIAQNEIHDEFVARTTPEMAEEVSAKMEYCMEETFPLPCGVKLKTAGSVGMNWEDAK